MRFADELEQVRVDEILVGRAQAVREAWVHFQCRAFHNLRRHERGDADGHNLIVVAMHDERWYVEPLEIFSEVRQSVVPCPSRCNKSACRLLS